MSQLLAPYYGAGLNEARGDRREGVRVGEIGI